MKRSRTTLSFPFIDPSGKYYLILFIFWPFLAFITALLNYNQKEARKVVYIFMIYYGLTYVIGNVGVDAERYAQNLIDTARLPFTDFFEIIGGLYSGTTVDIVEPFITFVVSRFTSSHSVLFAVLAALFGFFYLKSINLLYDQYRKQPGWDAMIFMTFFIMVLPITTVGGVRMPIALWIFVYAAYHVIINRDPRYLILALASSLMHWSLLTANVILLIYFLAGNRNLFYIPVAFVSFIMPQILAPVFESLALGLGGEILTRYEGYSSEGFIWGLQESAEGASWFLTLSDRLIYYYLIAAIIIVRIFGGKLMEERADRNLFSFLILFLSFVNFGSVIPTFGRFQYVFYLFAAIYIFRYFLKESRNGISFITWLGLFPMLLHVAVTLRIGADSISVFLFTPGLGLPLLAPSLSIIQLFF